MSLPAGNQLAETVLNRIYGMMEHEGWKYDSAISFSRFVVPK